MLYLYHHCDNHWNLPSTPSVGNNYELIDVENIHDYDWDVCEEVANNKHYNDEEMDWSSFVESNGGSSKWFEYDNTDIIHLAHKGFEDQRPGAAEYHKKMERATRLHDIAAFENQVEKNSKEVAELIKANASLQIIINQLKSNI